MKLLDVSFKNGEFVSDSTELHTILKNDCSLNNDSAKNNKIEWRLGML